MTLPTIQHFSDVLCVWAYVAHVRLEETLRRFEGQVRIDMHFVPVFSDAIGKLDKGWSHRGGIDAYAGHVAEVVCGFDHAPLHPDAWRKTRPASSASAHLFLKAVALTHSDGARDDLRMSAAYRASWSLRQAFFCEARDISQWREQAAVAEALRLDIGAIETEIDSGRAMAALCADSRLCEELNISGSPTFRMNAGRQILYGNVGFRLIEANINELLRAPNADDASWC